MRLLLLTNDGCISDELVDLIARRAEQEQVTARVLVPIRPVPDEWAWDEDATRAATLERLDNALTRLARTGASAEGTVGCDRDPMVCVNWLMQREPFDEVILAVPLSQRARRLRLDLAARIRRAFGVPVTHVAPGRPAPAAAA